jgi:hypothetical protein
MSFAQGARQLLDLGSELLFSARRPDRGPRFDRRATSFQEQVTPVRDRGLRHALTPCRFSERNLVTQHREHDPLLLSRRFR